MDDLTKLILDGMGDESVHARRMFGGVGFFKQGLMFALIADEVFYLKADKENAAHFDQRSLAPFRYTRSDGSTTVMSYREAPGEALESPDVMREWAERGFEAACRADHSKPPSQRKRAP